MTIITILKNGPAIIEGDHEIHIDNKVFKDHKVTNAICLCGKSKNYPFCDGGHKLPNVDPCVNPNNECF